MKSKVIHSVLLFFRKLGRKVKGQMEERRDVKGWYYHPFPAERYYKSRKEIDSLPERTGPKI